MALRSLRFAIVLGVGAVIAVSFASCVEPPPKIAALPPNGLSLRVFVFGASATEGRHAFEAAKQNNKNLRIVHEGGDGEILVGLENDSPKCVPPTAMCSFKVALRIRDNQNKVVHSATTTAIANSDKCSDLCTQALNSMVVKAIEAAAGVLQSSDPDASVVDEAGAIASSTEPLDASSADAAIAPPTKKAAAKPKAEPAKPEPALCAVGHGARLPSEEAEKRAAQVEALKRLSVLDQDEYDCLRKAYLDRL